MIKYTAVHVSMYMVSTVYRKDYCHLCKEKCMLSNYRNKHRNEKRVVFDCISYCLLQRNMSAKEDIHAKSFTMLKVKMSC